MTEYCCPLVRVGQAWLSRASRELHGASTPQPPHLMPTRSFPLNVSTTLSKSPSSRPIFALTAATRSVATRSFLQIFACAHPSRRVDATVLVGCFGRVLAEIAGFHRPLIYESTLGFAESHRRNLFPSLIDQALPLPIFPASLAPLCPHVSAWSTYTLRCSRYRGLLRLILSVP